MKKPLLNFWQIWNMSFGFLGIQFGWGLQMANMSAIYNYLGAKPDEVPFLWLAAPLTGLLVQPIIGYLSDRTWTGLGRRKPYFLTGAILSSLALIAMPNSSSLWMAAGLLWVLDASINISMEPFRAFVADMLPTEQQTRGYTMQSVFIGLGAVIASALPWMMTNWFHVLNDGTSAIPLSVKLSFYIGAVAFFGAVLYTIVTTKEYPPEDIKAFEAEKQKNKGFEHGFKEITHAIANMPSVMKQLAAVQFFTWLGLFLMWFYFGTATAKSVFGATSPQDPVFNTGIEWGGICFAFYSLVTFVFSFLLPYIAENLGRTLTHFLCLLCGAAGLLAVGIISNQYGLLLSMAGVGIAWASILSMPYSILVRHLPPNKTGIYVGIFNFFIVIPEILAALFFGWIMGNLLNNNELHAVMTGGAMMLIAALIALTVKDKDPVL
jgi:maltose/moltooligosaccharide transporter